MISRMARIALHTYHTTESTNPSTAAPTKAMTRSHHSQQIIAPRYPNYGERHARTSNPSVPTEDAVIPGEYNDGPERGWRHVEITVEPEPPRPISETARDHVVLVTGASGGLARAARPAWAPRAKSRTR